MGVYITWSEPANVNFWAEPKATHLPHKSQPNAYYMYTDLKEILSARLCLYSVRQLLFRGDKFL
jgi:hypothetical protein